MKFEFLNFLIRIDRSPNELWYTFSKDGSKLWYLFDISITEREIDNFCYKGLQIVLLDLHICIADTNSLRDKK